MKNQINFSAERDCKKSQISSYRVNVKQVIMCIISLSMISLVKAQNESFPIQNEDLKRGAYQTYNEFLNNDPSITDSFYIESKKRNFKNWKGTISPVPRFRSNGKKIKKIWGFCDGNTVFIFHQKEFFPIEIHDEIITFYGYGNRKSNNTNVGASIAVGTAEAAASIHPYAVILVSPIILTGGIIAVASTPKYKKQKVKYSIDLSNNRKMETSPFVHNFDAGSENLIQNAKLIFY